MGEIFMLVKKRKGLEYYMDSKEDEPKKFINRSQAELFKKEHMLSDYVVMSSCEVNMRMQKTSASRMLKD